jgi:hypothetical protein
MAILRVDVDVEIEVEVGGRMTDWLQLSFFTARAR